MDIFSLILLIIWLLNGMVYAAYEATQLTKLKYYQMRPVEFILLTILRVVFWSIFWPLIVTNSMSED